MEAEIPKDASQWSSDSIIESLRQLFIAVLGAVPNEDASFLELGGDSLAAMVCISRIWETYGVELALEEFLIEDPNIMQLAAHIEARLAKPRG